MYKYILFDLDGTLTNPELGITNCVMYALEKFNIKVEDRKELQPWMAAGERRLMSFNMLLKSAE